jgi:putative spermidine/putrescine transport system permease protein
VTGAAARPVAARSAPPGRAAGRPLLGLGAGRLLSALWLGFAYAFLLAPLVVIAGASLHGGHQYTVLEFPPRELSLQWYFRIPEAHVGAILLSIQVALATAVLSCLLGVPAALGLVRGRLPGKGALAALFRAPLQIPSVVIGIAFMQLYYAIGKATGFYAVGTFFGLVLGHVFHATPYVVGTTTAILQRFDPRLEEAALSLGAGRWRAFRRVTLPLIAPGVYAGALYAFMISFGDVPISIFLIQPGYTTYPVELFFSLEADFNPSTLASATLVVLFSLFVMLAVQRLVGFDNLMKSSGHR